MNVRKLRSATREQRARTLYVRLPQTIKSKEVVEQLFFGDFQVKLPRQSGRYCHVTFSSVDEKLKNLEMVKNNSIDGKRIVAHSLSTTISTNVIKKSRKKIRVPEITEDPQITQTLFICNIKCGTKIGEIKQVFPGCVSVALLKPYTPQLRSAIVKLESVHIAAEYLTKKREWPVIQGNKLFIYPDTRVKHKKGKKKSKKLKIYDGKSKMSLTKPKKRVKSIKSGSTENTTVT